MQPHHYIAVDLGAESGRVMLGTLTGGKLKLEEMHRFGNGAIRLAGTLRWDLLRLWEEIKAGLVKVAARKLPIAGVSVDSWALDYVLMRGREPMLRPPYQYRDPRTERTYEAARERMGDAEIFKNTGVQFMPINTLYHLLADLEEDAELLRSADRFLMVADWFHYLLSGRAAQEESNASTTQLWDPRLRTWSDALIASAGLPRHIFPDVVPPCTELGPLLPELAAETGLASDVAVIAGCTHDTGAAVAAVPAQDEEDWAYLSSGTWSLIGVELPRPQIDAAARAANFTNETGVGCTSRFLRNASGLWILQECRRIWQREGRKYDYGQLTELAEEAEPLRSLIDPGDARFLRPEHMPEEIRSYCRATGQPVPETPGQFARCVLESLALLYRQMLAQVESITGRTIRVLHIVGGGSRNALLNQFAANATGRTVLAGPVEATAIGNVLLQAVALGHVEGIGELRRVVRESFAIEQFDPQNREVWTAACARFSRIISHYSSVPMPSI